MIQNYFNDFEQLNFLLHMCLPYPEKTGVYPFLYNMGYKIQSIEQSFPLEDYTRKLLSEIGIKRKNIKPELVLQNEENTLLFECKTTAFDASLQNSSFIQANCYLSTKKQYINDLISSKPTIEGKICYFVPEIIRNEIEVLLDGIKSKYIKEPTEFLDPVIIASNLDVKEESLKITTTLLNQQKSTLKVMDIKKVEDPNFFELLLYNPGCGITEKDSNKIMLRTQAVLLRLLGKNLEYSKKFSIEIEEIAKEVSQFYEYLEKDEQEKLKNHIVIKLKKMFSTIDYEKEKISVTNSKVSVDVLNTKEGKELLRNTSNFKITQQMSWNGYSKQLQLEL